MAVSTRHLHRRNLRVAYEESGEDFEVDPSDTDATRRTTRPSPHQTSGQQPSGVLDALSNEDSKLARFLFVGEEDDDDEDDNKSSWFCGFRQIATGMRSWDTGYMALALEPMNVRNERIIMLFEAYAIFGALFMNGVWIIYEWGSWKGYGDSGTNIVVKRIFECLMALTLSGNVILALWGAVFWISSINLNSSHRDYAFESITSLAYMQCLMMAIVMMLFVGLLLGIYINLSPHWPETIFAWIAVEITMFGGIKYFYRLCLACFALEMYHYPAWIKYTNPNFWFKRERDRVKGLAKLRAQELKKRAYRERETLDPSFRARDGNKSSIGVLLDSAAMNLGRPDCDTFTYEARLAEDWFTDVSHLNDMSVRFVSQYMPYRLAEEVHKLIEAGGLE